MSQNSNYGRCQCVHHRGDVRTEYHLHRHHLAPKSQYPEYANDPRNALMCCPNCHFNIVHKDGNLRELSRYGETLMDEYLRAKGYEPSDRVPVRSERSTAREPGIYWPTIPDLPAWTERSTVREPEICWPTIPDPPTIGKNDGVGLAGVALIIVYVAAILMMGAWMGTLVMAGLIVTIFIVRAIVGGKTK